MDVIALVGYFLFLFVGIILGLMGGGGALLVIPILTYLFKKDVLMASSYSLFIICISSFFAVIKNFSQRFVNLRLGLLFGIPDLLSTYLFRRFVVPDIPFILIESEAWYLERDKGMMLFFAVIMLVASLFMIRKSGQKMVSEFPANYVTIIAVGSLVGMITGLIGVGGGFLIVPSLILLGRLETKKAIGTSLVIVFFKSAVGFIGDLQNDLSIEWVFLLTLSAIGVAGIFIGNHLKTQLSGSRINRIFGVFALSLSLLIILKETIW